MRPRPHHTAAPAKGPGIVPQARSAKARASGTFPGKRPPPRCPPPTAKGPPGRHPRRPAPGRGRRGRGRSRSRSVATPGGIAPRAVEAREHAQLAPEEQQRSRRDDSDALCNHRNGHIAGAGPRSVNDRCKDAAPGRGLASSTPLANSARPPCLRYGRRAPASGHRRRGRRRRARRPPGASGGRACRRGAGDAHTHGRNTGPGPPTHLHNKHAHTCSPHLQKGTPPGAA